MPMSPRQRDGRRNSRSTDEEYVVFIQGIPPQCRWQELKDLVRQTALHIRQAVVYDDCHGHPTGLGQIIVKNEDEAWRTYMRRPNPLLDRPRVNLQAECHMLLVDIRVLQVAHHLSPPRRELCPLSKYDLRNSTAFVPSMFQMRMGSQTGTGTSPPLRLTQHHQNLPISSTT
ncbi:RNA binding protein [Histoplasma capsulatum]|uniref:RNA binding protein n=1 Tax=Ajellomyces capsulatus TaxID=5037 RepID=A0A8A1M6M6_AJECA|nr:RNA binding protein [Histoplasma capsulatum]